MGYIVQSIVFDKDKGWDIKTARKWIKDHKEFSEPIKEEETINTIRVRLFPPKKAEQMGFTDYRMKTLASGDVGIMLDIAYNKLEGGADDIQYEDEDPIEKLRNFNSRLNKLIEGIMRNINYMRKILTDPNFNLTNEQRTEISNEVGLQIQRIKEQRRQIKKNNDEIKFYQGDVKFGSGIGKSKAKVAVMDTETERRLIREEKLNNAFIELSRLTDVIYPLQEKLYRIKGNLRGRADTDTQAKIDKLQAELDTLNEERNIQGQIIEDNLTTGGSLANEDLQALLAKSYSKNPEDYKDFKVDKDLSGQRVQVYHNPTTQQTIVAHRGTSSVPNWIENVAYAVSNDKSGKAFQHSKKIQDQAYSKYGKENITTIGHSKGALHAQEYGKEGKEIITLNKPVNITDALFTRVPKSQTDIRTQYDPVSFLRPFQRGSKVETIKSTTKNPLKEHKTSVLGRLDPRRLFGSGEEGGKRDPNQREKREDSSAMVSNQQLQQEQEEEEQQLQQNRERVNAILEQEINNITQLFRRQREDRLSLQEGLVPEFLLEDQIGYANASNLAQRLREAILEQVTADTDVSNPQQIASNYRRVFTNNLRIILTDNRAERRVEEPNTFVPISEGSGMAMCSRCGVNCSCGMMRGGMVEEEENFGVFINPQQFIERRRQLSDELRELNYTWEGTDEGLEKAQKKIEDKIELLTRQMEEQQELARIGLMNYLKNREIKRGRGMSGGVIVNFGNGNVDIPLDMSSGNNFVNSFLSWYLNSDEDRADRYMNVMNRNDIDVDNMGITLPEYLADIQGHEFQELINVFEVGNNNAQSVIAIMNSGNQDEIRDLIMGMMDIVDETIQGGEAIIQDITDNLTPDPDMNIVSDEEQEGAGMSGGANMLDITSNRITYNIDLSSKQGFYNTALPYYNAVNIRSYRIDGNMYAIRDVVNQWNIENPEWNRHYQQTIIPKIIRSMKTTNSNDTYLKLQTFRENMTKWADILVEYLDFSTDDRNYYPTAPNTPYDSDEEQEGAGMTGGVVLPQFDVNIGRAFRDAKRRWAKSPKMFENLAYERRLFDDKYGKLMRYIRIVSGQGDLDNTSYVELLMYSNWVKDLDIPEISKGAGKKAKKAKKGKN
jgi:hypothetical protein